MNLKNRIKKLENKCESTSAESCDCFDNHMKKLVEKIYDNAPYDENRVSLPVGNYCDKCRKPVSLRTQTFNKSLEMIYG